MKEIVKDIVVKSLAKSIGTSLWILRIMAPVSLAVKVLWFFGVVDILAQWLEPLMHFVGLPGHSAIVVITGGLVGTHAGLAALVSMPFTLREATIITVMICLCHALILEGAVVKKIGPPFAKTVSIRIVAAFMAAWALSHLLPAMSEPFASGMATGAARPAEITWVAFGHAMADAAMSILQLAVMILAIMFLLILLKNVLTKTGLMDTCIKPFKPLMAVFGLSGESSYLWLVGNIVGLSYGAGVLKECIDEGRITQEEARAASYHLIMSHSIIDDTLSFAAFGVTGLWIVPPRLVMAIGLVWGRKFVKKYRQRTSMSLQ